MPHEDTGPPRPGSNDPVSPIVRLGLGCGLLAPLLWAAVIVIAGEWRPGFDHLQQYISELGERGSSTGVFMRYGGFVASGALHLAYAAAFYAGDQQRHRQRLHSLSATLAFLSIAAAVLLAARLFRDNRRLRPLAAYSLASAAIGLLALVLMTAGEPPHAYAGLFERLASGVFSLWVLVTAGRLWQLCRRR